MLEDLKANNRVQIECESHNPFLRTIKGVVIGIEPTSIAIVTDFGELHHIESNKILSISKISFDRIVSEALTELRNHFNEVYELELKLTETKKDEKRLVDKLYDANFLAKFNIMGAKNRLDNSVPRELMEFRKDSNRFKVSFDSSPNNQIELNIKIWNVFEDFNLDEIRDLDKIIRAHAPKYKDVIQKSFNLDGKVEEFEKKVEHEGENSFSVSTVYHKKIDVTQDNFLLVRKELIEGLQRIKK